MDSPAAESPETRPAREILRELRQSAREAAVEATASRGAILSRRQALRRGLVAHPFGPDSANALREHLALVRSRIERLESDTSAPAAAAAEILEHRGDLAWIPLMLPERGIDETVSGLSAEVASLETAAADLDADDTGETAAAIREARRTLTHVLTSRMEDRARGFLADDAAELEHLWTVYLEARDLSLAGEDTTEIRHALRARIEARAAALAPSATAETLSRFAAEYEDRALDVLAVQSEATPERAAESLDRGRRELAWLRSVLRNEMRQVRGGGEEERAAHRTLRRWSRRLGRSGRRLAREGQEVRLQARMESIFGARFTSFLENAVLWLILAVLGVLVAEALLPDPHPAPDAPAAAFEAAARWRAFHRILVWSDAGICAVFLLEFFLKLALVRGRVSWFLRHFLVDLIPSIPYGLIAAHALDSLRAGRMVRFARIPRLVRYVRVARPIVRFFRFFGFLQRGLDRLVRLHGNLLNRNVVLFEPAPIRSTDSPAAVLGTRIRELRALARRAWRRCEKWSPDDEDLADIRSLVTRMPGPADLARVPPATASRRALGKVLRAEELVNQLTTLDPGTVEAELGDSGAKRFAATLDRIDVPILRLFPGLRQMVRAARSGEPLDRVVRAAKALGRWLGGLLGVVTWLSDLSGVISGPQFLDRLGSALVQATARPAKRLLIFGFGFLILNGVVELVWEVPRFQKDIDGRVYLVHDSGDRWHQDDTGTRVEYDPPFLVGLTAWLKRILGTPFIVLGAGCLVVLLTGTWFRRIAGEATDFYTRTAEAQYINLLKSAKLANLEEDLSTLWQRVLGPEALLRGDRSGAGERELLARFEREEPLGSSASWSDKALQLYQDYLDGALFHSSDTKTTSQLLGNLALENIRTDRLRTTARERRQLVELNLDRERSAFRGPYLWFRSINHSVAQWTAKLLLDYNRRAIPLAERRDYPTDVVAAADAWLERRLRGERTKEDEGEDAALSGFVTTEFTALHFLTVDEDRDEGVRRRFGPRTLQALRSDRRAMIRTIFGTYPFHRLPRADRTLNPFDLYGRHLAGGRAALLPLYVVRLLFHAMRWLVRRIRTTLREILNPTRFERQREGNWASFEVAVRKINRMRKPLYMECARFRASFDPEYLGLALLPEEESGVEGRTFREDVESIGARDEDWDPFQELREGRADSLRELGTRMAASGGPRAFIDALRGEGRAAPWREAHRAVSIAWAIDYRDARTLSGLAGRSAELVRDVVERRGRLPGAGPLRRAMWLLIPARARRQAFLAFLSRFAPADLGRRERRWIWTAVRAGYRDLARIVDLAAALEPGTSPEDAAREVLRGVSRHPESWSEQLVTLRTVQSLSVLDVRNYRRQVRDLGGYENG